MRRPHEPMIAAAAGLALLVLIVNAVLSYRATKKVVQYGDEVSQCQRVLLELDATRSALTDAESADRGYLISGKETDLEPYWSDVEEIDGRLKRLEAMVANSALQRRLPDLRIAVGNDLGRLDEAIILRRRRGLGTAAKIILTDGGKRGLDQTRLIIGQMEAAEQDLLYQGTRQAMASGRTAIVSLSADKVFAVAFLSLVYLVAARLLAERRRNETRIKEQREWFRVTLSSIGDAVIATDTAGRITFMNSVAHAVTGWDAKEAEGKPLAAVLTVVDEETRQTVECCAEAVMRDGVTVGLANEALLISRDGREVPIDANQAPIRDAQGAVVGVVIVFHDVSERRQTELARRRAEQHLREIVQSIGDAFYALDRDWRFTYVNQQAAELFGREREALIGKTIWEEFPEEVGGADYLQLHRAMTAQAKVHFESFHEPLGIWCDTTVYPSSNGLSVFVRDITKRKRTLERLRDQAALLDQAYDGIAVRDLEHRVTFWNRGAERMYGWTANEVLGKDIRGFVYSAGTEEFDMAGEILFEKGEWNGELHHQTKSGKPIIADTRWTLVRDDKGEPKSIFVINMDITEKKALEAQFYRAQRMESIGTLASGIAHDLNNLLSPITTAVNLLQRRLPGEQDRHVLSVLNTNAQSAASLIRQILSFAKGVKGERISLQPNHLIRDIAKTLGHALSKSIHIDLGLSDDLWTISGDPTQIHQVLMNLCVNARDAMPHGGTLSIRTENIDVDENRAAVNVGAIPGRYVLIRIADTGTGIPSRIIDRIFEPFFTTKELGKGTGLGLSTSLAIVKNHGGFIEVVSEQGHGTEFKIYLPPSEAGDIEEPEPEDSALPPGNGELILMVDDEAGILQITKATLETYGYRVMTAADGPEALMLYTQHQAEIKAVVIDVMMPFMEGPATIRALQRLNLDVKVIISSGLDTDVKAAEAVATGWHAFLPKPYTAGQLLKTLAEILDRRDDGQGVAANSPQDQPGVWPRGSLRT